MRIAIVKLSALGDIIHAMVALQFIKAHAPETEIDWVVEEQFAGILQNNPHISQILTVNLKALKNHKLAFFDEYKKIRAYAANNYTLVIDAQGLIKSAIVARLLGKKVAGFDKNSIREKLASCFYDTKVAMPYSENTIDRNALVLSQPLGFTITKQDILTKQAMLYAGKTDPDIVSYFPADQKNIVLVISSSWESKNYPPEKFVKIAQKLTANYLIIWGNAQERRKAEWIAGQCANIKVLPKLDLDKLKTAIMMADLVIGNDTGPTHMAWALNRPSITIFGSTPIRQAYQTDINKVIKSHSIVNPYKLNRQDYSIRDIDAEDIIEQATQLLNSGNHP